MAACIAGVGYRTLGITSLFPTWALLRPSLKRDTAEHGIWSTKSYETWRRNGRKEGVENVERQYSPSAGQKHKATVIAQAGGLYRKTTSDMPDKADVVWNIWLHVRTGTPSYWVDTFVCAAHRHAGTMALCYWMSSKACLKVSPQRGAAKSGGSFK